MRDRLIARQTERPRDLPRRAHHDTGRDIHGLSNISDNLTRQMVAETLWEDDENFQRGQSAAPDTPKSLLFLSPIVYNRLMSYGHFVLVMHPSGCGIGSRSTTTTPKPSRHLSRGCCFRTDPRTGSI